MKIRPLSASADDLLDECHKVRENLEQNHVIYAEADQRGLQDGILSGNPDVLGVLGEGFYRVVILDMVDCMSEERFSTDLLLQHTCAALAREYGLDLSADPHWEDIPQVLKDEARSVFCIANTQLVPGTSLGRLRGFTQDKHHTLFLYCGPLDYRRLAELGVEKAHALFLIIKTSDGKSFQVEASAGMTLGRGPSNDCTIPERFVSRRHAILHKSEDETFLIEDLGSRNGTLLDGVRLTPGEPHPLSPGSMLVLAGCTIHVGDVKEMDPPDSGGATTSAAPGDEIVPMAALEGIYDGSASSVVYGLAVSDLGSS